MTDRPPAQRALAYAQFLRVSNALTAVADVWMGMIVATGAQASAGVGAALTLASVSLYLGGMGLNDVLDAPRDAEERPTRPIPSGRVPLRAATAIAWGLLAVGVVLAAIASYLVGSAAPVVVGGALACTIWAYDGPLKHTRIGPWAMGACRGLNVLLGMSAAGFPLEPDASMAATPVSAALIALGLLIYVYGVTEFARTEAKVSSRTRLLYGATAATAGLGVLAAAPYVDGPSRLVAPGLPWAVLWGLVALLVLRRMVAAVAQPQPHRVQSAVGNAIQSIIVIDAAIAWGYAGPFWGLALLALLPPTLLLARFIPPT